MAKGDNVESLSGLACEISGLTATESYDVKSGTAVGTAEAGTIAMLSEVAEDGSSATLSAIVHPSATATGDLTLNFTLDAKIYKATLSGRTFVASKMYEYETTIGNASVIFGETCTITDWTSDERFTSSSLVSSDALLDMVYNNGVYEIYTAAGLYAFADLVNGEYNTTASVYWGSGDIQAHIGSEQLDIDGKLMADINLAGSESNQWTPIGDADNKYSGTFDGDGHLVSGLYINNTSSHQGLFGRVDGGTIKNVGVSGSITGVNELEGIVGCIDTGTIMNCYNMVVMTGSSANIGGITGSTYSSRASITNCYNMAAATGSGTVGGIVGYNGGGILKNCYNTAAVYGSGYSFGYIVGCNNGANTYCYYFDIDGDYASNGIGQNTTGWYDNTTKYGSSSSMTSDTFRYTLDTQVSGTICLWAWDEDVNGGYPTLDFGSYK